MCSSVLGMLLEKIVMVDVVMIVVMVVIGFMKKVMGISSVVVMVVVRLGMVLMNSLKVFDSSMISSIC